MKYFSVPANYKTETIDRYRELNNTYGDACILETYGQITDDNPIGSGRAYDLLPKADINLLKKYIEYSQRNNIGFNYTLNTICMSNDEFSREGIIKIIDFLEKLYLAGVRSITVALPSLIEIIRKAGFDFEIKASTVCQITNANKAIAYKDLGADRIVLDESINRDFTALKSIRNAFGPNIELIANVICHKNCIYEIFHHNQTSHDIGTQQKKPSVQYYSHRCMMQRCYRPSTFLKMAWIRPEDLHYYTNIGITMFKLQGRQAVIKGDVVKTITQYMNESYEGNLMDLLDMFSPTNSFSIYVDNKDLEGYVTPFALQKNHCVNNCIKCSYCEDFANNRLPVSKIREVFDIAKEFYCKYDEFSNIINTVAEEREVIKANECYNNIFDIVM